MAARQLEDQWRDAFARQARSDKQAYEGLSRQAGLAPCHRLHYLQMFLEKLSKALLWAGHRAIDGPPDFLGTHGVIAKVLPMAVKEYRVRAKERALRRDEMEQLRALCREIDLLAPAVDDDGRRPDNCEYPWAGWQQGQPVVWAPCQWTFRVDARLRTPLGQSLLKTAFALCENAADRPLSQPAGAYRYV